MTRQIKRAVRDEKVIWARQEEIRALYEAALPLSKSIQDAKIAALRELHQKIMELRDVGRRELEQKELLVKERIDKAREELMTPMLKRLEAAPKGAVAGDEDQGKQYKGVKGWIQNKLDRGAANLMGAQRFFDYLDGQRGTFDGPWVRYFVDQANAAKNEEFQNTFRRREWMEKKMAELRLTPRDLTRYRDVNVPKRGGGRWTVDELMSVYAGLKNEKSRAAILYGNFAAAGEQAGAWAAACVEALKPNERKLADAVIEEYELNFDRVNEGLIAVYNKGMDKEPNYTPMRRLEFTTKEGLMDPSSAEALMNATTSAGGMGRVEQGFRNSRIDIRAENQRAIDLGLLSLWNSQMQVQEHAAAFAGLIRDMRKILLGRNREKQDISIAKAVKEVHGQAAWDRITNYFNILARNKTKLADDVMSGVTGWLMKNMNKAYLCANLGTILKQTTSFYRALPYSGPTHMLSAIGQAISGQRAFLEECYRLDPQLRARQGDLLMQALEADPNSAAGVYEGILDKGMAGIAWMDRVTSAVVWKAVYDANLERGRSPDAAVREAQRVVLLTQPTTQLKDATRLQQQGGMMRLAMVFTNDLAQTFGITAYDLTAAIRRGDAPGFLWTLLGVTLAAGMMGLLTTGGPDDDEWDTLEGWAKWWAKVTARQSVESIPVWGKGTLALWDSWGYTTGETNPYLAPLAKFLSGAHGLWDDKDNNDERAFFNLMEAGALLAPFPATALRRIWRAGRSVADGEVLSALGRMIGVRRQEKKIRKRAVM